MKLNRLGDICAGNNGGLVLWLLNEPAASVVEALPYAVSACWFDDQTVVCSGCKAEDDPRDVNNWKIYFVDKTTRQITRVIDQRGVNKVMAGGGNIIWEGGFAGDGQK